MKKETIFAIGLGIFFGAFFGFFLINKNDKIDLSKKSFNQKVLNDKKTIKNNNINFIPLEIIAPENYFISDKDNIDIIGKSTKNSLIVVQSPIKDIIYKNQNEEFKINIPLALGENLIKIVDYPKDKNFDPQEKTLRIYYLKIDL